ncbi:MAG: urate hydroxylase PuuD [Pseudomonadota bacterium]
MTLDPHIVEWLSLTTRWIHFIVGVAWIGASFYFNWLEGHLERQGDKPPGVAGDIWSVHGGGFYHAMKYEVAPPKLPETLHWFKWEAYATWLSGVTLMIFVYYLNPLVYMVDPSVMPLSGVAAVAIGIASMVIGWLVYDALCKSALGARPGVLAAVGFVLVVLATFVLTQLLSGRAAFLHIGAMLGTIMVANVAHVIIPNQRKLVDALGSGGTLDPELGKQGLLRSRHNNYITLPVLFLMISNHYPSTYSHAHSWLIMAALVLIGVGVRHYFNLRHKGKHGHWMLVVAAAGMAAVAWFSLPERSQAGVVAGAGAGVSDDAAFAIVEKHCVSCHAVAPTDAIFTVAPSGMVLDTIADMKRHAVKIQARSVDTNSMPLGNTTLMTDEERATLGAWIAGLDAQ